MRTKRKSNDNEQHTTIKLKKKKREKKQKHKDKRKRKRTTSNSSDSSNGSGTDIWVEKVPAALGSDQSPQVSSTTKHEEETIQRDEWMSLNSLFPCISQSEIRKQQDSERSINATTAILAKPGQSDRELNPYWKNGGTGLPQTDPGQSSSTKAMDVAWLKKSLRRMQEQAEEEGRSLDEIVAERWGSLEDLQRMIREAEDALIDKERHRYKDHRSNHSRSYRRDERRDENIDSGKLCNSGQRSRSPDYNIKSSHSKCSDSSYNSKRVLSYKKPVDENEYLTYRSDASHTRNSGKSGNWRKDRSGHINKSPKQVQSHVCESSENIVQSSSDVVTPSSSHNEVVTEADLNKLGSQIIKAEIMGDDELASKLKLELEEARKDCIKNVPQTDTDNREETVILTKTDAKGISRPIQPRLEDPYATGKEKKKKKKHMETHVSGERVRYFADDDKYSLQEMFQRERGRSANDDDAMLSKLMSKKYDNMDELFEEKISQSGSSAQEERRERAMAIQEHKRMSKRMENCSWCIDSGQMLRHMIIQMDADICLSLPAHVSLTDGHCILTPVQHVACQLQLDENVWEKLKIFKQALNTLFLTENQYPIFFETYKKKHKFPHMRLQCVPVPKDFTESVPMYFKKALLECETEWATNKKIIDLRNKDPRRAIPNGLSYFMVQFGMYDGYAHVIEDEHLFPHHFAQQTIAGILELEYDTWRKPRRESFEQQKEKVLKFSQIWKKLNPKV